MHIRPVGIYRSLFALLEGIMLRTPLPHPRPHHFGALSGLWRHMHTVHSKLFTAMLLLVMSILKRFEKCIFTVAIEWYEINFSVNYL